MPQNPNDFAESSPNERYTPTAYTQEDRATLRETRAAIAELAKPREGRTDPPPPPELLIRVQGDRAILFGSLAEAQAEFGEIEKNCTATVTMKQGGQYKFKYADLGELLAKTRPHLNANGYFVAFPFVGDGDGFRVGVELLHSSGGWMSVDTWMPAGENVQGTGATRTYLTRYLYSSLLGVAAEDDDDANSAVGNTAQIDRRPQRQPDPAKKPPQPASQRSSAPAKAQEPERPKEPLVPDQAPTVPSELTEALGPPMTKEQDDRLHVICRERGLRTAGAVTRFAKDTLGVPLSALDMAGGASLAERLIKAVEELKPEDVARSLALRPEEAKS